LRLRDILSGVDSSSGRKSSRSSSRIGDSAESSERRILACLFRILIGPKIEVSPAGVPWVCSLETIDEFGPDGEGFVLVDDVMPEGRAGGGFARRLVGFKPPDLSGALF
jgi:hypothetical protein